MIYTIIVFLIGFLSVTGCGKAPAITLESPEPEVASVSPLSVPVSQPVSAPAPQASASPVSSPTPTPTPPTTVVYASTAWNLICPAFNSWNSATTTLQINYASYFYTFSQSGVTYTLNGVTSTVGQDVLLYGTNPSPTNYACKVTIQSGQIVSIQ